MTWRWLPGPIARFFQRIGDARFRFRNRVLSNPWFQRWTARAPLLSIVARSRTTALFDLGAGFVYSQVYQAIVRLRVMELVQHEPMTVEQIAGRVDLSSSAARRLLDAAVSIDLLERRGDTYGLGIHGCSYVGNPSVAKFIEHHALFYRDLADPVGLLRGEVDTELNRFWAYANPNETPDLGLVAQYSELMAATMAMMVDDILEAYPLSRHRRLVDVGGGEGAFVEAVAGWAPELLLSLFDLPEVARRASDRLDRVGLASRVEVHGGDAFVDPLPRGADVISLVRVLHDHEDDQVLRLLRSVREALGSGGVVLVAEPMRGSAGMERRMADAYFAFYLLAMGQGRPRSPQEVAALLTEAGFEQPRPWKVRRPMLAQLMTARVA